MILETVCTPEWGIGHIVGFQFIEVALDAATRGMMLAVEYTAEFTEQIEDMRACRSLCVEGD